MLTKEQFREIYTRYESSGLSVRDFCRNEGLAEAKFYYWQKKLSGLCQCPGFVPLVIESPRAIVSSSQGGSKVGSGCFYEISYPGGTLLKLSGPVDYELLRSLILING
jgi:hypothetical protein